MSSIYDAYEPVIGIEVHVQLGTKSKAYCGDATTYGASPNTQVSPISLGHPGTLPVFNKSVMNYAVKLGIACDCTIRERNEFAARTTSTQIYQRAIRLLKTLHLSVQKGLFALKMHRVMTKELI